MPTNYDGAEARYATWRMLEEGTRSEGALGLAELVRLLDDPGFALTPAQSARLFASPDLRAAWAALKGRVVAREMPAVAAASDGGLLERAFEGGRLRLTPSTSGPQIYLLVVFEPGPTQAGSSTLILETPDGMLSKRVLQAPDEAGETFVVLDVRRPADAMLAEMLRNPLVTGSFVVGADDL